MSTEQIAVSVAETTHRVVELKERRPLTLDDLLEFVERAEQAGCRGTAVVTPCANHGIAGVGWSLKIDETTERSL